MLVLYNQTDTLVIASLVSSTVLGWYSAATQLFATFLFIPVILMTSIFPALTRTYTNDSAAAIRILRKCFDLMLLIAMPIGLGLVVISDSLVVLLYGQAFAPSGPVLAIMGVVLICTYQNILLGRFLISIDRQNVWTLVMIGAAVATIC